MSNNPDEEKKKFSLEEARALLPRVRAVTDLAAEEMSDLARQIQVLSEGDTRRAILEQEYVERLNDWAKDLQDMGCEVKGTFLVDFDNGEGYYCWKWPEPDVTHFHGYEEGFAGRMKIN